MSTEFSDLPTEVVRYILTFVPTRHQASLVCKEFYEHICSIEKDYYKLELNSVKQLFHRQSLRKIFFIRKYFFFFLENSS